MSRYLRPGAAKQMVPRQPVRKGKWAKVLFSPAHSSTIAKLRRVVKAGYVLPEDNPQAKFENAS